MIAGLRAEIWTPDFRKRSRSVNHSTTTFGVVKLLDDCDRCGRKRLWLNLTLYLCFRLEWLKKITKKSWSPLSGPRFEPYIYKIRREALTTQLQPSVVCFQKCRGYIANISNFVWMATFFCGLDILLLLLAISTNNLIIICALYCCI
jgi:hypothetical protein